MASHSFTEPLLSAWMVSVMSRVGVDQWMRIPTEYLPCPPSEAFYSGKSAHGYAQHIIAEWDAAEERDPYRRAGTDFGDRRDQWLEDRADERARR